jgi:DNA-binding CsgD family transcriptional regulator
MLVGRDHELHVLDGLLEGARTGRSGVLAIVAEIGMGKSALLDTAALRAEGMTVLRARGIQSEARIPFAGLLELCRPVLGQLASIPPPQAAALEAALALRPPRRGDRFAIGAATLNLLASAAESAPLLLLVDDAHWIDGSTGDALLFASRRLLADPVAVIFAVRSGEPSLVDGSDLPIMSLPGLDGRAAAQLLAGAGPEPLTLAAVERLHRQTGGNPLALLELARDSGRILDDGPLDTPIPVVTSVANAYIERCRSLPARTRAAVLLASASDTGDLSVLAKAGAGIGVDLEDLGAAEGAGLLTIGEATLEFRHPLVRSAIYADAGPEQRREAHRALAGALADAQFDRRAWHLALAAFGPDDAACSALAQAGAHARDRSAYAVASPAFERAAHLASDDRTRTTLLQSAADAAWLGGLAGRAVGLLDEAAAVAPPDAAIPIEHLRGHIATRRGPVSEARRILLEAGDRAAATDPDRSVVMLAEALNAAFYAGDPAGMTDAAARVAAVAPRVASRRGQFFATIAQGMALVFGNEAGRGATLLRAAVGQVENSEEFADDPRLLSWAAMGPLWLRDTATSRDLIDRALEVARRQSAVGVLPFLLTHVAIDRAAGSQWSQAEATFHEGIDLARETEQRTDLAALLARLAWLEARQGREHECRAHAHEALELSGELGLGLCQLWALAALGDLELGLGHTEGAVDRLVARGRLLQERGIGDPDLSPAPELAEAYLRLGDRDRAAQSAAAALADASRKGQPWALARACRAMGTVAPDEGMDRHFRDALAHHDRTPDLFEAARTRLLYGARLRRSRQRTAAREHLRAAIDDFDRLGAEVWGDAARVELAATGEKARQRNPGTLNQLTPQELQIAMLLAGGATTREAAMTLFLSPKTIEYHLRSVYRKLDISSRAELAGAVATAPPVERDDH